MHNITLEQLYRESDDTRQGVDVPQDAQLVDAELPPPSQSVGLAGSACSALAAEAVDWGYCFVGALVFASTVLLACLFVP